MHPGFTIFKTVLSESILKWWYCTWVFKHLRFNITLKEPSFLALAKIGEIYSPSSWPLGVITLLASSLSFSVSMTYCSSKSRIFFWWSYRLPIPAVHWHQVHPHSRSYCGLPIQVFLPSFKVECVEAFMPVSRIDSICVVVDLYNDLKTPNGNERVIVAVPLDVKLHL